MFRALLVLLPIAFVLVLEGGARLLWAHTELDPYLSLVGRTSALTRRVIDGREMFVFTHPHAYGADSGATFPVHKPAGTLRVVAFGGSANAGYPHRPPQRWTDYLQRALARVAPGKQVEVINLGAHACASYRVRMIFDDAIDCDPDAVVLYTGNNEFVERRSYFLDYPGKRLVEGLRAHSVLLTKLSQWWSARSAPENVLSAQRRTDEHLHLWTHIERIASDLRSQPAQYEAVKEHYRYSLEHMVAECERRRIPVYVLTVPVNLRDWSPAVSATLTDSAAAARFDEAYRRGQASLLRGDAPAALAALDAALQVDPDHAEAHFERGKALEALGRREEAYSAYAAALDNDRNPFRAAQPFATIVRQVAAAHPGAHLVDAVHAFRTEAVAGAPGFDLFLDYVHPSRAGNLVLARVVFEAMVEARFGARFGVTAKAEGGGRGATFAVDDDGYRDDDDEPLQLNLLALYGIMHQYDAYLARADAYEALRERRGHQLPAAVKNVLDNTRRAFREYLDERRKEILGEPFAPDYEARHEAFYKQFFLYTSELKGALVEPGWGETEPGGK